VTTLGHKEVASYAALGLPLAMAALPLFVHLPKLYVDNFGIQAGALAALLLFIRLTDAVTDPLFGWLGDVAARRPNGRMWLIGAALIPLTAGFIALFAPPTQLDMPLLWLGSWLLVVSLSFGAANIGYQAVGARICPSHGERVRVAGGREAAGLVGILLASLTPTLLGYDGLAWLFALTLALGAWCTLRIGPKEPVYQMHHSILTILSTAKQWWGQPRIRRFVLVFVLNGIAVAIPATLFLFFVDAVIEREDLSALFLTVYFLSGALGMTFWVRTAQRIGNSNAWAISMLLAMLAFAGAFTIGSGDVATFLAICVLSGLALGADLAIPPALVANLADGSDSERNAPQGLAFGLGNFLSKAVMAISGALALGALALFGDDSGSNGNVVGPVYALLPLFFKAAALSVLFVNRERIEHDLLIPATVPGNAS
jgi:Na+/melibiose symporter-like transporter